MADNASEPETRTTEEIAAAELAAEEQPAEAAEQPAVAAEEQPAVAAEQPAVAAEEQPAEAAEQPAVAAEEQPAVADEAEATAAVAATPVEPAQAPLAPAVAAAAEQAAAERAAAAAAAEEQAAKAAEVKRKAVEDFKAALKKAAVGVKLPSSPTEELFTFCLCVHRLAVDGNEVFASLGEALPKLGDERIAHYLGARTAYNRKKAEEKVIGRVKSYNTKKGFGFIDLPGLQRDIFVYNSHLIGRIGLIAGESVEFVLVFDGGRPQARQVRVTSEVPTIGGNKVIPITPGLDNPLNIMKQAMLQPQPPAQQREPSMREMALAMAAEAAATPTLVPPGGARTGGLPLAPRMQVPQRSAEEVIYDKILEAQSAAAADKRRPVPVPAPRVEPPKPRFSEWQAAAPAEAEAKFNDEGRIPKNSTVRIVNFPAADVNDSLGVIQGYDSSSGKYSVTVDMKKGAGPERTTEQVPLQLREEYLKIEGPAPGRGNAGGGQLPSMPAGSARSDALRKSAAEALQKFSHMAGPPPQPHPHPGPGQPGMPPPGPMGPNHGKGMPPCAGDKGYGKGGFPDGKGGFPDGKGGFLDGKGGFPDGKGGFPDGKGGFPDGKGGYPMPMGPPGPGPQGFPGMGMPPPQGPGAPFGGRPQGPYPGPDVPMRGPYPGGPGGPGPMMGPPGPGPAGPGGAPMGPPGPGPPPPFANQHPPDAGMPPQQQQQQRPVAGPPPATGLPPPAATGPPDGMGAGARPPFLSLEQSVGGFAGGPGAPGAGKGQAQSSPPANASPNLPPAAAKQQPPQPPQPQQQRLRQPPPQPTPVPQPPQPPQHQAAPQPSQQQLQPPRPPAPPQQQQQPAPEQPSARASAQAPGRGAPPAAGPQASSQQSTEEGKEGTVWRVLQSKEFCDVIVRASQEVSSKELRRIRPGETCEQRGPAVPLGSGLVRMPVKPEGWVTVHARIIGGPTFMRPEPEGTASSAKPSAVSSSGLDSVGVPHRSSATTEPPRQAKASGPSPASQQPKAASAGGSMRTSPPRERTDNRQHPSSKSEAPAVAPPRPKDKLENKPISLHEDPWAVKSADPWANAADPWADKSADPWAGKTSVAARPAKASAARAAQKKDTSSGAWPTSISKMNEGGKSFDRMEMLTFREILRKNGSLQGPVPGANFRMLHVPGSDAAPARERRRDKEGRDKEKERESRHRDRSPDERPVIGAQALAETSERDRSPLKSDSKRKVPQESKPPQAASLAPDSTADNETGMGAVPRPVPAPSDAGEQKQPAGEPGEKKGNCPTQ